MTVSPQWKHAHDRFRADITRVAKKNRLRFRTMTDLVNTAERYPPLIPVLIDWLKHTEARTGLTDPHECHEFRDGLARSLMTPDAIGTEALPLLFDALYLKPQPSPDRLAAIGNALQYLAQPADYDRMRRIAADRTLSYGRAGVLEWLLKTDPDDALPLAVAELADPTVRPYILRALRNTRRVRLPATLRATVEPYLDDPHDEVRKQARRVLEKTDRADPAGAQPPPAKPKPTAAAGRTRPPANWFRAETWDDAAAEQFEQRLARARAHNRPQYLRIQGVHLSRSNSRTDREVARVMFRRVIAEYGESTEAKTAAENLADSYRRDGMRAEAEAGYRELLRRIEAAPIGASGTSGTAQLQLAELLIADGRYAEAADLLADAEGAAVRHPFHSVVFRFFLAKARVGAALGSPDAARSAEKALAAADATDPPFSKHPTIGFAQASAPERAELAAIAAAPARRLLRRLRPRRRPKTPSTD